MGAALPAPSFKLKEDANLNITVKKPDNQLRPKEVEIIEPLMENVILAERITGKTDGVEFQLALLSQLGTFDGEKLPPEELRRLSMKDFLSIASELLGTDIAALLKELVGQSLASPVTADSDTKQ